MLSKEERIKRQNELLALHPAVKEELMKIPGVFDVAIGLKEVNHQLTDEIVFQVFVDKKKGPNELVPEEIIPKEIKGVQTDVQLVHRGAVLRGFFDPGRKGDERQYRPLKGGIMFGYDDTAGTLGCFARLVKDNSLVVMTNYHIIGNDREAGSKVGQPLYNRRCCCCCAWDEFPTGVLLKKGLQNSKVDVALATIDAGIEHEVIIHNKLSDPISLRVEGTASAVVGDKVQKIGHVSGYTRGIVTSINGTVPVGLVQLKTDMFNQIFIKPDPTEKYISNDQKKAFSDHGDSGSVVLNEKQEIVGLLYGGNPEIDPDVDVTYACHIADVMDELKKDGLEIRIEKSPPKAAARVAASKRKGVKQPVRPEAEIKAKFLRYKQGKLWVKLFEKHRAEIWHLINHDRPVTVAWQRHQGPAFMAHLVKSAQEPLYIIPQTVENVSIQDLLVKTGAVLKERGSLPLQNDLQKFGLQMIEQASGLTSLNELFNRMAEKSLAANSETV